MRDQISALAFLAGLTLAAGASAQVSVRELGAESSPAPAIDSTTITQDVRFKRDDHDRMTVAVTVAGKGPYRFLVDTGADRTAVSSGLASRLDLQAGPTALLHSVTGATSVRTVEVPSLRLADRNISGVRAPVLEESNMGADGILGVDSLRSERVMFDFRAKSMSIVPSVFQEAPDPNAIVVWGKLRRGHLIVTTAKANTQPVTVVLDTGAELTIGNEALRRKLKARKKLGNAIPTEILSVTGQKLTGDRVILPELEVGGIVLNNVAILFADAKTFEKLKLTHKPTVLLGMNVLRAFDRVSIDFANRKFRVVPPERSEIPDVRMAAI